MRRGISQHPDLDFQTREMPYARVMNFVRTRLSIAILRATGHCVRGARRNFFSLSTDGGLAVALFS